MWPNPDGNWVFEADYDGDGVRNRAKSQWQGERKYSWSAFGVFHATNTSRTFTPGLAQRRYGGDKFIHPDHLGSTRWLSDGTGTFPHGLRYNAFGQKMWIPPGTTDWQPVDFLFAGESGYITEYSDEQNPGVALLYLQQRYYDPDIGRFLTPDPIGFAGGLDLYAYCGNDPVNRMDPSGLQGQIPGAFPGSFDIERSSGALIHRSGVNPLDPQVTVQTPALLKPASGAPPPAPRGPGLVERAWNTAKSTGRAVLRYCTGGTSAQPEPVLSVTPLPIVGFKRGAAGSNIPESVTYTLSGRLGAARRKADRRVSRMVRSPNR